MVTADHSRFPPGTKQKKRLERGSLKKKKISARHYAIFFFFFFLVPFFAKDTHHTARNSHKFQFHLKLREFSRNLYMVAIKMLVDSHKIAKYSNLNAPFKGLLEDSACAVMVCGYTM